MKFASSRLVCKTFVDKDFDDLFLILKNNENTKYYFIQNKSYSDDYIKKKALSMIHSEEDEMYFGIFDEDELIGILGLVNRMLYKFENFGKVPCVNILIDKKHQKKGYAYEILNLFLQIWYYKMHLFVNYGFDIYSSIYNENVASINLFKKLHFGEISKNNEIVVMRCNTLKYNNELNKIYKNITDTVNITSKMFPDSNLIDIKTTSMIIAYCINYKKVSFPYKTIKNPNQMFMNLIKYKPSYDETTEFNLNNNTYYKTDIIKKKIGYLVSDKFGDYEKINVLTDFFQEKCRMKCKRYDTEYAPIIYWKTSSFLSIIISKLIQDKKDITLHNLREFFYKNVPECGTFKLTIVSSILQIFNSKRILDISCGWGDRLIGAISRDSYIDYYNGCDPNTCVFKNYKKIINHFQVDKEKYFIQNVPFEHMKIDKTYDLVFTSPPFFDLEDYSKEDTQSIQQYSNLLDWMINFLFFSLRKAWDHLEINGNMVINMEDKINTKLNIYEHYTEPMVLFVNAFLKGSKYLGIIGHTGGDNTRFKCRPLFVWTKKTINDESQIIQATNDMKKYYQQIFEKTKINFF